MTRHRNLDVFVDGVAQANPAFCGQLLVDVVRGKEIWSFTHREEWLLRPDAFAIDPELGLYAGPQYPPSGRTFFGIFLDAAPDRWGRVLMKRREAYRARVEERLARVLHESDFLLGVHDAHRLGALRFQCDSGRAFLDDDLTFASPPWASLRELEHACLSLERDNAERSSEYGLWLRQLVAPGGSLGGARPKANVIDASGHPWIAKFPSRNDERDVGLWEHVVHVLAKESALDVAPAHVNTFASKHHTFLVKRFDRNSSGQRLFYMSAMTALKRVDGESGSDGASYLHIAEFLTKESSNADADLAELWSRIVFSMLVSNTDDHLRNHGFLLDQRGWRLSPAFDLNPNHEGDGLRLNVSEVDNSQDLALALSVAKYFRLTRGKAEERVREITSAVSGWQTVAKKAGATGKEQNAMARAFRLAKKGA